MQRPFRVRRSVLAVPASSDRFIAKARELPVDEIFLDLEDAVAPTAKPQARASASAALAADWGDRTVAVRINDATTAWAHRDVLDVVSAVRHGTDHHGTDHHGTDRHGAARHGAAHHGAARPGAVASSGPGRLDTIVLPKVTSPEHVIWLDLLLGQVEREAGLEVGQTGIEAQIEDAAGLAAVNAIAAASPRLEALVFGPADFMASVGIRSLDVGAQPEGYLGDVYHYPLMRILIAARARGLQAIDGPFLKVRDVDGFRRSAASSAALGYDGKWVLHPAQVDAANATFAPSQADFDHATEIIDAYAHATGVQERGAVMLGDEMIDEASHKMAQAIVAKGQASGLTPHPPH
jgi:citrate lyase subunit beta/citryl-CoA lyase